MIAPDHRGRQLRVRGFGVGGGLGREGKGRGGGGFGSRGGYVEEEREDLFQAEGLYHCCEIQRKFLWEL